MWYRTKKEILEHLGKDGKDVRYLDRAVASGEIIVRDRMYIVSKEYIEELEKNQANNPVSEPKVDKNDNQVNNTLLEKKLAESEDNLNFQIAENEKLQIQIKEYQQAIRNCYYYVYKFKKVLRPDFRDSVLKLTKEIPGEDNQ